MAGNVQELTENSFESTVLKSAKPVLVDFWAVWCGPCRQVAPIVESLATKWGDKVTVAKLNVDDVPSVAERYGIMSIPRSCSSRAARSSSASSACRPRPRSRGSSSRT